jgi:hypothetical protein
LPKEENKMYLKKVTLTIIEQYSEMSKQYLKTITTWCSTLLIMNIFYVAFTFFTFDSIYEMTSNQKSSCIAIGVILHFTLLSSFLFTFTITITQYLIFFKNFLIYSQIFPKSCSFSYGIALIIVIINLSIDSSAYINSNNYCWLQPQFAIYSVILPIGLILIVNLILFLLIMIKISKNDAKRKKYVNTFEMEKKDVKRHLIWNITLFLNTGIN